jgi:polysaccharide biosynthesis transport protein
MSADHPDDANYPVPLHRAPVDSRYTTTYVRDGKRPAGNVGEDVFSHRFLLWVLKQWWMYVVPAGLVLAAVVGGLVTYFHVPKYEATALLMIEDVTPFVAFSARGVSQSNSYVQTQLELLRSPVVLVPVLGRPEIASMSELVGKEDRVKFLQKQISILRVGQSELYNVSYKSPSPKSAADVVNAMITEYMTIHAGDEFQRSQRVIDLLEEERRRRGLEVERFRKRVVELAKEVTGRDPFGSNEVTDFNRALSPVGALFTGMTEVDVEREVLQAELRSLTGTPAPAEDMASTGLLDLLVENQEEIRARVQEIADLEAQMEQRKNVAIRFEKNPQWEKDSAYVALNMERTQRQEDLKQAKAKVRGVILAHETERRRVEREERIAEIKRQQESLGARYDLLSKRFTEQFNALQTGGAKSTELAFARAELEREESVFEVIASRKLALQTELRAPARVQLRQKAEAPSAPLDPIPYKLLLLATSAAFGVPFGAALFREITVRRISDIEQLAQESGLRVLGEVAALPVRYVAVSPHKLSGRLRRDTYIFAESINSLRTNLALADGLNQQVLAVTSASQGEGKTSVAVSLAMSISSASDQPTLIIDGDMRLPFAATMLKAKSHPGLFEVLSNECTLDDAIQRVGDNGLYIMPAGRATKSAHSVMVINEIKQLLDQLRARFSAIVIDTPPILGASESLVLAKAADAVILCSLCNVSKAKQVRLAIDRLEHAHANIAGAVLSGTPARHYEFVYGYYADRVESSS